MRGRSLMMLGQGLSQFGSDMGNIMLKSKESKKEQKRYDEGAPKRQLELDLLGQEKVLGEKKIKAEDIALAQAEEKERLRKSITSLFDEVKTNPAAKKVFTEELTKIGQAEPQTRYQTPAGTWEGEETAQPQTTEQTIEQAPKSPTELKAGVRQKIPGNVYGQMLFSGDEGMTQQAKYLMEPEETEASGKNYGKSSVGAAFEFTEKHPELVDQAKKTIQNLREKGIYSEDLLDNLNTMVDTDVRQANTAIQSLLGATEKAVRTIKETIPGKTEMAAATTAASTGARITTERAVGKTLPAGTATNLGDFESSLDQLGTLTKSFSNPDAPQGPISQIRKKNPYDWQAQGKQQLITATKQLIGKALEGGVLRAEDEKKYEKILPTMGDTFEGATVKAKQLEDMIRIKYKESVKGLKKAGYYTKEFETETTQPGTEEELEYDPATGTFKKVRR